MNWLKSMWVVALLTLPTTVWAQDFAGTYELEGRYSNRRQTAVELAITRRDRTWVVQRTGRYTSRRHRSKPAFDWSASEVRVRGRVMEAYFDLRPSEERRGLVDRIGPDASADEVLDVMTPEGNRFRVVYLLSSDGETIREFVTNETREGDEGWWRWIMTDGSRVVPPAPTSLTEAEFDRAASETIRDWYVDWVEESYADELEDARNEGDADRVRELEESRATDLDPDAYEVYDGEPYSDWFTDDIDYRYDDGDPFLDDNGVAIPREALSIKYVSMFPEFAGIGLSKIFVFDARTGDVVETSDIID